MAYSINRLKYYRKHPSSFDNWKQWFRNSDRTPRYYAMRFWYRLTGYVPDRPYSPIHKIRINNLNVVKK